MISYYISNRQQATKWRCSFKGISKTQEIWDLQVEIQAYSWPTISSPNFVKSGLFTAPFVTIIFHTYVYYRDIFYRREDIYGVMR